jgi:hypothetical protein
VAIRSGCVAIAKRLRGDCVAIHSNNEAIAELTAKRNKSECATITQQLRNDCGSIADRL